MAGYQENAAREIKSHLLNVIKLPKTRVKITDNEICIEVGSSADDDKCDVAIQWVKDIICPKYTFEWNEDISLCAWSSEPGKYV